MTFAHLINPVSASDSKELFAVQQLTFASLLKAKAYAGNKVNVTLCTTQFADARAVVPSGFEITPDLQRSVADVRKFARARRLPLIKDLLTHLYQHTEAEYLIYTNLDIGVMPQFYVAIAEYIRQGHDALIINRRRVSAKYNSPEDLDLIFSENGQAHIGYDTFIFKRELFPQFVLKNLCVGIPKAGNDIFYNVFHFAKNPVLLTDKHLTFHVGMDLFKEWGDAEYVAHNKKEMAEVLKEIGPQIDITKFPGSELPFFKRHFKWLMNPTFDYRTMMKADFRAFGTKRRERKVPEVNTGKQRYLEWLIKYINFD